MNAAESNNMSTPENQTRAVESHRQRHVDLHRMLDELCADWIGETGGMPSRATILDLMKWSREQTINPTDKDGYYSP